MVETEGRQLDGIPRGKGLSAVVEPNRGGGVAAVPSAPCSGVQIPGRPRPELLGDRTGLPQLDPIAIGLTKVVPEDLLELHQAIAGGSLEPVREARVKLRSVRLAKRHRG